MKSFAFAAVIGATNALDFDYLNYMATFNKVVTNVEEFAMRVENFKFAHQWIESHNASGASWSAGHNQFSDYTEAEYKQMLGYVAPRTTEEVEYTTFETTNSTGVNWVDAGAVTPVKDQGQCGSCWAFSSTGALEGAHFVASGELLSFSEQQLVDCAGLRYGNLGCNGGMQGRAFKYLESHNIELESVYPYFSGTTKTAGDCAFDKSSTTSVDVSTYTNVTRSNADQMKAALEQQPLAVSIQADTMVFQTYKSGILDSADCGTQLDHAVLAVGWGTESGQDYWLVKNSWASTWGDNGYIKMAITANDAGICGVQTSPLFPVANQ